MSEAATGRNEPEQWTLAGLIAETQIALATLRADDLEELARRAEQLLNSRIQPGAGHPRMKGESGSDLLEVAAGQRVLGELLQATDRNLNVLRRMRGEGPGSRWVL